MTRVVWLTDIHLNFLSPVKLEKLFTLVNHAQPDCVLISGDITEAPRLQWSLNMLEKRIKRPIHFVLGNHDYYSGSFADVQALVHQMSHAGGMLNWLTASDVVELSTGVGLIGHDGWADGRCGDYARSEIMLNDYVAIRDFVGLSKAERLQKLNALGDAAAESLRERLKQALEKYQHVFVVIHVPPFREACWHDGRISGDEWLPHYVCQAAGEALVSVMRAYPAKQLTVLCGHSHGRGVAQILPNLRVLTGGAVYGVPEVQQVFELG